jgi:hypothetical protein
MIFQSSGCQDPGPHFRSGGCLEKSISAFFLRFSVTIYDTVTAVRPQSYLSLIRLIPKCYSNLSLGFKGAPKKEFPIATAPKPTMAEVLQLCSYPVVVSPDAPPGVFGLLSIQMASIRPGGHPHGSGMVFALLAFCGVFAAPRPCFPKISGCFPRLMTECRSDSGCF